MFTEFVCFEVIAVLTGPDKLIHRRKLHVLVQAVVCDWLTNSDF
jgi:hypothetical protein